MPRLGPLRSLHLPKWQAAQATTTPESFGPPRCSVSACRSPLTCITREFQTPTFPDKLVVAVRRLNSVSDGKVGVWNSTPVISRSRHLTGAAIDRSSWQGLLRKGERVWLFNPTDELTSHP